MQPSLGEVIRDPGARELPMFQCYFLHGFVQDEDVVTTTATLASIMHQWRW